LTGGEWSVEGIPHDQVLEVWPTVGPLIEKALERGRGEMGPDDVLALLLSRDMQLWAAKHGGRIKAVCTTHILTFKTGLKVAQLEHAAGIGMREWADKGRRILEAWAVANGCQEIRGGGREGWGRVLGWGPAYVIYAKRLKD
jgi:hypothetical protein